MDKKLQLLIMLSVVLIMGIAGYLFWKKKHDKKEGYLGTANYAMIPQPPAPTDGKTWDFTENNGKCFPTVAKICSDLYENDPRYFHNMWSAHGECENDMRMIPMKCRPNDLKYLCKGDSQCVKDPKWNTEGVEVFLK